MSGSELSPEEKGKKMDELLDLIGPTEVFDLFYRKTDLAMRALTRVLPSRERGELVVRAVSVLCMDPSSWLIPSTQYLEKVDWVHRCGP